MKTCSKCKGCKSLDSFSVKRESKDGRRSVCKICQKQYYLDNKDHIDRCNKKYREGNKEQIYTINKLYRERNKKSISLYQKQYYADNKDNIDQRNKEYNSNNRNKLNMYHRKYAFNRIKRDTNYRLTRLLRARLNNAIKGNYKAGSAVSDLGCSIEELKKHLENQFQEGMSWDNWSRDGWHIDHIVALANFDLSDPEQFKKACHYSNLQPMWAKDNLSKGAKKTG